MTNITFRKPAFGHVFNLRLFVEGLKRLRVTTTAVGILSVVASALVPFCYWMEYTGTHHPAPPVTEYEAYSLCIPAALLVLLAPIFFFVLFSFLKKRKQSDFFHAIPYTRTCVYVSFTVAALVSVFAIQILSAVVAGVLWGLIPYVTFDLGAYCLYILADMLGAAMLAAFMMLALTVSGTGGSTFFLFALFAYLTRVVLAIFAMMLQENPFLGVDYWFNESILSPWWFYPLSALCASLTDNALREAFLFHPATVIYSVAVTVLLFVLAGFLYNRRQSEMAGNPAPGKRTQALFRILFTLPAAFLLTAFFVTGDADSTLLIFMIAATLLCYFLYELLTTKRARNMITAIPGLGIVLVLCIAFGLTFIGTSNAMINRELTPEKISSVTLERRYFLSGVHEGNTRYLESSDPEVIDMMLIHYDAMRRDPYMRGNGTEVVFHLENGREVHRQLRFAQDERAEVIRLLLGTQEFKELDVPDAARSYHFRMAVCYQDVFSPGAWYGMDMDPLQSKTFLETFSAELDALSSKQKLRVMSLYYQKWEVESTPGLILVVEGTDQYGNGFSNQYLITADLPRTQAYMLRYFDPLYSGYIGDHMYDWSTSPERLPMLMQVLQALPDGTEVQIEMEMFHAAVEKGRHVSGAVSSDEACRLIELVSKGNLLTEETLAGNYPDTLPPDAYAVHLRLACHEANLGNDLNFVTILSETEVDRIIKLLG